MPISLEVIFFGFLAAVGIILAVMMLTVKSPVHAALCLVGVMATLAVHYIMLHAYFLGVVQIVVYAGAIMVLFLYIIMFFYAPGTRDGGMSVHYVQSAGAIILALVFLTLIGGSMYLSRQIDLVGAPEAAHIRDYQSLAWVGPVKTTSEDAQREFEESNPALVGKLLFSKNLLPFEITGFLLLAAMMGAFVLAKRSPGKDRENEGGSANA